MLRIHQFGSLEAWITTIQILSILVKIKLKITSCPLFVHLKSTERLIKINMNDI